MPAGHKLTTGETKQVSAAASQTKPSWKLFHFPLNQHTSDGKDDALTLYNFKVHYTFTKSFDKLICGNPNDFIKNK